MHIVISTDTDQYHRIYCNISVHIARPYCDVFDRIHRLARSEALQPLCFGTQLAVNTSDQIECEMQLVLLPTVLLQHPPLTGKEMRSNVSLVCIILAIVCIEKTDDVTA